MQQVRHSIHGAILDIWTRLSLMGGVMKATKSRKTKITIETERVWVLERPGSPKAWCPACGKLVTSITPEEVATLASSTHAPHFRVKIDKLHFVGSSDGLMLVCSNSLLGQTRATGCVTD